MLELNKIYCGDCQDVMLDIDNGSVDGIVTDPPYQLSSPNTKKATKGFMGKSWDICPSVEIWRECLRVLKPGAFAFVMCIPRQDCLARMICRLEDAGFNVAFSPIYWTYASGFPKARNLSKAADKRNGIHPNKSREFAEYIKKRRLELDIKLTEMDNTVCGGTTNYSWFEGRPKGQRLPRLEEYNRIKKILKINNSWDRYIGEAEREIISKIPMTIGIGGNSKRLGNEKIIDLPATPQAKALDGAYGGFQPKPAVEVVIVAMKSIEEKTYIDQALKNGQGCTWLDDCRIPYAGEENTKTITRKPRKLKKDAISYVRHDEPLYGGTGHQNGRFPANVLCEDDVLDDGRVTKSVGGTGIRSQTDTFKGTEGHNQFNYGDIGSYSRYFSLDSWFAERIKLLPKEAQKTFPWLIIPKASKGEKNRGCEDLQNVVKFSSKNESDTMLPSKENKAHLIKGNFHPTCKSIKLMSWLITLASREGDIVLDPFCGSGTTAIAAKMLGRQYIGIEREEDYCEIARKRIAAVPTRLNSYNVL